MKLKFYGLPVWLSTFLVSAFAIAVAIILSSLLERLITSPSGMMNGMVAVIEGTLAFVVAFYDIFLPSKKENSSKKVISEKNSKLLAFNINFALIFYSLTCLYSFWKFQNGNIIIQILKNIMLLVCVYTFSYATIKIKKTHNIKFSEPLWIWIFNSK